jgi:glucose-1-phosphate cytidylyltransferase
MSDITFDMKNNQMIVHEQKAEPWTVTLVDTGENSQTGGRLRKVRHYLTDNEPFCFTYGDGVSDVNISQEVQFHKSHGKLATICAVQPPGRYGALDIENQMVKGFQEKPLGDGGWINGGYFILQPECIDFIENDFTIWEKDPLENLAKNRELKAFHHEGFWQPMDTLRDKVYLEELWSTNKAPWKIWL